MKIFLLKVLVIDGDIPDKQSARSLIDANEFPNHTWVESIGCQEAEIGEWHDDHPLNTRNGFEENVMSYFEKPKNFYILKRSTALGIFEEYVDSSSNLQELRDVCLDLMDNADKSDGESDIIENDDGTFVCDIQSGFCKGKYYIERKEAQ